MKKRGAGNESGGLKQKMKYVLALDQGTTSSRAAIVGEDGKIVCILNREFPQIYPREGWVEHDPMDIWSSQYGIMMEAIAKSGISVEDIASIGITNQRETTIVWEKATGKPVPQAILDLFSAEQRHFSCVEPKELDALVESFLKQS